MNSFEKLLVQLVQHNVQFVTIGGLACAFNGHLRSTEDVDILISNSPQNLNNFFAFLEEFSPQGAKELSQDDFKDEAGAIRIIEEFPLDVFVQVSGFNYADLKSKIQTSNIDEYPIPYLSKEGLIKVKSISLREIDKMDVLKLKELSSLPD